MNKEKLLSSTTNTTKLDYGILILRLAAGCFILYGHGLFKFNKFFSREAIEFIDPFGVGHSVTFGLIMFAEFFCAILIIFGLLTRWATIPLIIGMGYAAFIHHSADDFGTRELPMLYLFVFVAILLLGPGKHSFDRLFTLKTVKNTI